MPLGTPGYYGTYTDGAENRDYCIYCYKNGAFTNPNLTMEGMIALSVSFMTGNLGFEQHKADEVSRATIPHLKRWKSA